MFVQNFGGGRGGGGQTKCVMGNSKILNELPVIIHELVNKLLFKLAPVLKSVLFVKYPGATLEHPSPYLQMS